MTAVQVNQSREQVGDVTVAALRSVTVIIPALNEQSSLPRVLGDLPRVGRVIVVDNGSTDATPEVAELGGATVVEEQQRGYGAACLRGLSEIRELVRAGHPEPQVVAFVDADYSDHPNLLPQLVLPILNGRTEFVLGSRLLGQRERGAMPPQSVYGNKLACFLMWVLFGARYTDLGPFRAIAYDKLCDLGMADENFGWTIEMQIKAACVGRKSRSPTGSELARVKSVERLAAPSKPGRRFFSRSPNTAYQIEVDVQTRPGQEEPESLERDQRKYSRRRKTKRASTFTNTDVACRCLHVPIRSYCAP